jgi:hypothetical protein
MHNVTFCINLFRSSNATEMFWLVCLFFCSMDLSMPTMPGLLRGNCSPQKKRRNVYKIIIIYTESTLTARKVSNCCIESIHEQCTNFVVWYIQKFFFSSTYSGTLNKTLICKAVYASTCGGLISKIYGIMYYPYRSLIFYRNLHAFSFP